MNSMIEKEYLVSSVDELLNDYTVITSDEYFALLDSEPKKRSQMVAKNLTKYLRSKKHVEDIKKISY